MNSRSGLPDGGDRDARTPVHRRRAAGSSDAGEGVDPASHESTPSGIEAPPVEVLLSTRDGARYLQPLVDSVLAQRWPNVTLRVRDDGSSDGTPALLEQYAADHRIEVTHGEHLGVLGSFMALLEEAGGWGYVAFCDQDDVWLPDKIACAAEMLSDVPAGVPALYCSRLRLVDADLGELGLSPAPGRPPSLANALVENVASGCTVVMNGAARRALLSAVPDFALYHDWWAYLVVAATGRVLYDDRARILYRKHDTNKTDMVPESGRWQRRLRRVRERRDTGALDRQASELLRLFGDRLAPQDRRIVRNFLDRRATFGARLRYALAPEVYRQSRMDDLIMRGLIALDLL